MTKGKITRFFLAMASIFFLLGNPGCMSNKSTEPAFEVIGDEQIMSEATINVRAITFGKNSPAYTESITQTLLYKNKRYPVEGFDGVVKYKIYFSYKNQVALISFNNVYEPLNGSAGRINEVHIKKNDEGVYIQHFGTKSYLKENEGFASGAVTGFDEFFEKHQPGLNDEEKQEYKNLFFNFYEPDKQRFQRDRLTRETIEYFKKKPLEQKKIYGIFPEDLEKMDLPKDELEKILEYYKTHPIDGK